MCFCFSYSCKKEPSYRLDNTTNGDEDKEARVVFALFFFIACAFDCYKKLFFCSVITVLCPPFSSLLDNKNKSDNNNTLKSQQIIFSFNFTKKTSFVIVVLIKWDDLKSTTTANQCGKILFCKTKQRIFAFFLKSCSLIYRWRRGRKKKRKSLNAL
jgi:hypothetical protein